jgi:hypothetical protein
MDKINDSNIMRVLNVASDLVRHPGLIKDYISSQKTDPISMELPWISFSAIHVLQKVLKADMNVFEYGSGGSTIFFARRCKSVVSVEDSQQWSARVLRAAADRGLHNIQLLYRSTPLPNIEGDDDFAVSQYVEAIDGYSPDVILIDGSDEWLSKAKRRTMCFGHAERIIKPDGIIIVDDSWAYPEIRSQHNAKNLQICSGVGPCRLGSTSTDLYFY